MNNGTFIGTYRQYRQACLFKFSLASYPEEFDFELIKNTDFIVRKIRKIIQMGFHETICIVYEKG